MSRSGEDPEFQDVEPEGEIELPGEQEQEQDMPPPQDDAASVADSESSRTRTRSRTGTARPSTNPAISTVMNQAAIERENANIRSILETLTSKLTLGKSESMFKHEFTEALLEAYAYQGLNIKVMQTEIIRKALGVYAQLASAQRLIYRAVGIGLLRGNNVRRILETVGPEAKDRVQEVITVFNLKAKPGKNPKAITFSRMAACFPEMAFLCAHSLQLKGVVDVPDDFPAPMRTTAFGALIPPLTGVAADDVYFMHIKRAYIYYQVLFSRVLRKPATQAITADEVLAQGRFVDIAMSQSLVPVNKRIKLLDDYAYGFYVRDSTPAQLTQAIMDFSLKYTTIMQMRL